MGAGEEMKGQLGSYHGGIMGLWEFWHEAKIEKK